jgi:hypothetical protein
MYIQQDILGRQRGLKFGSLAAENILPELAALGVATGSDYSSAMIAIVVYWGLFNNAFAKRQELDVTFEQVCDWVDEIWTDTSKQEAVQAIVKAWEESTTTKTLLEKVSEKKTELTSTVKAGGSTYEVSQ